MLESLKSVLKLKDLRNKITLVLLLLLLTRLIAHIPLPGIDTTALKDFFLGNQTFGMLDLFSGGAISNFSIALMGVGPYITSSIVFQLLGAIVPYFEALKKEGEAGKQKLNYYTRIATVPFAAIQSFSLISLLQNENLIQSLTISQKIEFVLITTAGSIFLMWLGEIITERGIGNGISLIISVGIIAGFPTQIRNTLAAYEPSQLFGLSAFVVFFILAVALIVMVSEAQRQIPITYARRVRASGYGTVASHLPIRLASAGVIPIIFALAILTFPTIVAQFLSGAKTEWIANGASLVQSTLEHETYRTIIYLTLVILFSFFYTYLIFKPKDMSENLQKQGAFIPGIRPGVETERYINYVLLRITTFGALFIGLIAVMPFIVEQATNIGTIVLGGTGLLIIVSVTIETYRQLRAQIVSRTYDYY